MHVPQFSFPNKYVNTYTLIYCDLLPFTRCTLYQHPRIRWSRRRRSVSEPEIRHRRSTYLRQYYNSLRRRIDPNQESMNQLYDKYNHNSQKPTLRHANFKLMKKFDLDLEEEDEIIGSDMENDGENFPTAVYTVYNVHGEPIGHRLYSYQPVYEPEEEDIVHHEDVSEYEESDAFDNESPSHVTILKGGLFPDHELDSKDEIADGINALKHQYFERYIDKRHKRFSNLNSTGENKKELNLDLQSAETEALGFTTEKRENKTKRSKRDINAQEKATGMNKVNPIAETSGMLHEVTDILKVIPIKYRSNTFDDVFDKEIGVIPLHYNRTNSNDVDNKLDKRNKRTSRKTDRLNQTTASVPKT